MSKRYIIVEEEILGSAAWNHLTKSAIKTYMNILRFVIRPNKSQRRKCNLSWDVIMNNGRIGYSENDAVKQGLSKCSHNRGVNDLIAKGFINIEVQGGRGIKNQFRIIDKWKEWYPEHKGFYKKRYMPVGRSTRFNNKSPLK